MKLNFTVNDGLGLHRTIEYESDDKMLEAELHKIIAAVIEPPENYHIEIVKIGCKITSEQEEN